MFCRWDENGGEKIPEYLRPFYKSVIQTTDEVVSELKLHNNKHAEAVREVVSSGSTSSKEERDLLMSILTSGSRYIQLLTKIHINNQMLHVVKSYMLRLHGVTKTTFLPVLMSICKFLLTALWQCKPLSLPSFLWEMWLVGRPSIGLSPIQKLSGLLVLWLV